MKTIFISVLTGALALACSIAVAQKVDEITVQAARTMQTKIIGRSPTTAVPIVGISLGYGVSYADLDLASAAGATELERRVNDAADAACKEIGTKYPNSQPANAECAKAAAKTAMKKVHELVVAAGK